MELEETLLQHKTTIINFRLLLEQHQLMATLMKTINYGLEQEGLLLKGGGTLVDGTLIHAAPATKNRGKILDPDVHQTKDGKQGSPSIMLSAGLVMEIHVVADLL